MNICLLGGNKYCMRIIENLIQVATSMEGRVLKNIFTCFMYVIRVRITSYFQAYCFQKNLIVLNTVLQKQALLAMRDLIMSPGLSKVVDLM